MTNRVCAFVLCTAVTTGYAPAGMGKPKDKQPVTPHVPTSLLVLPTAQRGCLVDRTKLALKDPHEAAFLAPLLGLLLPKLVDRGLDAGVAALAKAGAKQEFSVSGTGVTSIYSYRPPADNRDGEPLLRPGPDMTCIQIIRLADSGGWTALADSATSGTVVGVSLERVKQVREALGLPETPGPAFLAEFAIEISPDRSAFRLVPAFVYYGSTLSGNTDKSPRDLVTSFAFKRPGATAPFAAEKVILPRLVPGGEDGRVGPSMLRHYGSGWLPLPALSEGNEKRIQAVAKEKDADKRRKLLTDLYRLDPTNILVTAIEVRDGKKWAADLAEVLGAVQPGVQTLLERQLVPEKRDAALRADAAAATAVADAFDLARLDVVIAQADLDVAKAKSPPDPVEVAKRERALLEAQQKANEKARAADQPEPYPRP